MADAARQPPGVPIGGQFAPVPHPEGDVTIDATVRQRRVMPLEAVSLHGRSFSIDFLAEDAYRAKFLLDAPYQRGSVWTDDEAEKLVMSLIQRIPTGVITLSELDQDVHDAQFRVVDGKQRIEAIRRFFDGDLAVPVDWFPDDCIDADHIEQRDDGRGGTVDYGRVGAGLTRGAIRHLSRRPIECVSFSPYEGTRDLADGSGFGHFTRTEDEAIAEEARVFGLINSGGVAQTAETLAHAASFETRSDL